MLRMSRVPSIAPQTGTAAQILDVAERLVQTRGFNGFSYADIASELGVTKATLHYHFRTKAELGGRLMVRYTESFGSALASIGAAESSALEKLQSYVQLYGEVIRDERMCLCGMLAAEYATLPPSIQVEIRRFFDVNEQWLTTVAEQGREANTLRFDGAPAEMARLLVSTLEGAMLIARSYDDPARFDASARRLLDEMTPRADA